MRLLIVITIIAAILGASRLENGHSRESPETKERPYVTELRLRPALGIEYARAVRFKLASRKKTYRVGEMVNLDLAMLNTAGTPIFIHRLLMPSVALKAIDEKGREVSIRPYATVLEGIVPESYQSLESDDLLAGSFQLLVGCVIDDLSTFEQRRRLLNEEQHQNRPRYQARVFEQDLFVSWGDACLDIRGPGKFILTAEHANDHVIVSSKKQKLKTAVGTIGSMPLTITIVE